MFAVYVTDSISFFDLFSLYINLYNGGFSKDDTKAGAVRCVEPTRTPHDTIPV